MSSNSVKPDSARKWHRQLGHLNQADMDRNAPETVGELDDVCNVCALAKITETPVPKVAETQVEEKLKRVFKEMMGPFRVESLSGFRFCIVFADQYTKFVFVDLLKAKSEALARLKKFVLSVGTPKKLRKDLLDEGPHQLVIWHPDDGSQDDGNKEEQGRPTAIKEEWHDAESVSTQTTILRPDASDVEEAALDEESTSSRGSLKDSEWLEDSETEDFSQSETVGFFEKELESADRAESRRVTRANNVPLFLGEVRSHPAVTEGDYVEPKTVYEAKHGDDWDQWHRAMKYEFKALQDHETWNLVRPPTDRDVIPGKWVYKAKLGPNGQVDKYNKRYVEKSFKQVEELDYFETFVCRLNKSIHGLPQAANNWYKEPANFLLRQVFTRSRNGHCLFTRAKTECHTFILVWVDDTIVASRSLTVISDVKKALEAAFLMEERGRIHWFLCLRISREEGKITVDQERYKETMLERFQMDQCKPSTTPTDLNWKLQTAQNVEEEVD